MTVLLLAAAPGAAVSETEASAPTCADLLASPPAEPAASAAAVYRTACRLKEAGLDGDALLTVVRKAAETDPAANPPKDLLDDEERGAVARADRVAELASAVGRIAGAAAGLCIGLWALGLFLARGVFGRSRTLRNIVGARPLVIVAPLDDSEQEQLPSLFQSVLDNLGNDVGGQNIQFVSPQGGEATEVSLADAPSEVKYLSWVLGLLRPLAPKDRITVRLAPQPAGRQGLGMNATLIGPRGSTIKAITLWEAEIELGDIATASPPLSEKERYQLLAGPLATWVYFALADLRQKDVHLFGARRWRSYGLFYVGSRLYKTHRALAQQLLRAAIDDDPGNIAAHLNVLYAEFDYRRTPEGEKYFDKLRAEVEALPDSTLAPRRSLVTPAGALGKVQPYWYEAIWYRTMYGLAAVCLHIASDSLNKSGLEEATEECKDVRSRGEKATEKLVGACWVALTDLEGTDGSRPRPWRLRTEGGRARFRQKLELAALLNQMLPSAVLLLANFRVLTSLPAAALDVGAADRIIGPETSERWRKRNDVLARLNPVLAPQPTPELPGLRKPELADLLNAVDPVEFLSARARYNVACLHSEAAQYQHALPDVASASRAKAIEELEKGLTPGSAQWAREDPALHELRTDPHTRPRFARLLADALPARAEWQILQELPFLEVIDAARLWLVDIGSAARLLEPVDRPAPHLLERVDRPGARGDITEVSDEYRTTWIDRGALEEWTGRARLLRHLRPLVDDPEAVDRVESVLHRLGIATVEQLVNEEPWLLSKKLEASAPPDWKLGHLLRPWAVAVWCRAPSRDGPVGETPKGTG